MRFLESWTVLAAGDLVRLLAPLLFAGLLVGIPGRASARFAALGIAAGVFVAPELIPSPGVHAAWIAIWAGIAWTVGRGAPTPRASRRLGLLESGAIGFLIGVALLVILLATFGRQDLPHDETRRTTLGLALVVIGLLHLMTRRHTVRAAAGLALMGLGLQIVDVVAWETLVFREHGPSPAIAGATAIAAALVVRIGRVRERVATSPWVGDAHDLHD